MATIYKGMFEFMVLQCIAIALLVTFPAIATWFPEHVRRETAAIKIEKVDDSKNRLEEDPFEFIAGGRPNRATEPSSALSRWRAA